MEKKAILEQAKAIACKRDNTKEDRSGVYLEQAEEILLNYLKEHPHDTEAWLMLMMIEWTPPLEDLERIIKWARAILAYDPTNAYAFLVLAEAHWFYGGITEDIYVQLDTAKNDDPNVMAMIEIAKAKYLEYKEGAEDEYERVLKKSIEYGPEQARNYHMLGKLYIKQGKIKEGEEVLKKGLENEEKAKLLYGDSEDEYDPTSLTQFLNEWYTGL